MVSHVHRYDGMHIYLIDNEELRRRTADDHGAAP
jgi:hypothetical protein